MLAVTPPRACARHHRTEISADDSFVIARTKYSFQYIKNMESDSNSSSSHSPTQYKVYARRWYILIAFSLMSCLQCSVWNTFGPIVTPVEYAYDWTDAITAMMANWGTICFVISVFPLCWLLETKGLRITTLTVAAFIAIGTSIRTFSRNESTFTLFAHFGAILNGISGATIMSAPPALSAIWFPPEQRTTATCINQVFNSIGNGVAFFMGPYLVPDDNSTWTNTTASKMEVRNEILVYMGVEAGMALFLFTLYLIYFPSQPPTPPSASASLQRTQFKDGLKALIRDKNVAFCTFAYSLSGGINGAWASVMVINFRPLGVSDEEAGYIGIVSCFVSAAVSLSIAYFTDHLRKHMKLTLIILLILETLAWTWLLLICSLVIPFSTWQLYASTVLGTSFTFSLAPLFFEYTAELAYPVPEGLVGGYLTCFNNFIGGIFLAFFFIPGVDDDVSWMNYTLVASAVVSIPAVIFTKESYRRLDIDVPATPPSLAEDEEDERTNAIQPYLVMEDDMVR